MKRIKELLKLRKQRDYIKVALFFILLAMYFLGTSVFNGINMYKENKKPMELNVINTMGQGVSTSQISSLGLIETVTTCTQSKTESLTIIYQGMEISIECKYLSDEYIEKAYNIKDTSENTFYCNEAAYNIFKQKVYYEVNMEKQSFIGGVTINYIKDNKNLVGKIYLVELPFHEDEPYIFALGEGVDYLQGDIDGKIMFSKYQPLEEINKELAEINLTVDGQEELNKISMENKMALFHIKYNALLSAFSIFIVIALLYKRKPIINND